MQNITVFFLLSRGTTDAASSEVQPMTSSRFLGLASRLPTAGSASAGSPRVSFDAHAALWPRIPPAALIAFVLPVHHTRELGPSAASTPLNSAPSATTS